MCCATLDNIKMARLKRQNDGMHADTTEEMEKKVRVALDNGVTLLSMRRFVHSIVCFPIIWLLSRYANRAARYVHAYREGLLGAQALKLHGPTTNITAIAHFPLTSLLPLNLQ
jgi:hypothetical protein